MSLFDRTKGPPRDRSRSDAGPSLGEDSAHPMEDTVRLGMGSKSSAGMVQDGGADSSIISEAAPSELSGDFGAALPRQEVAGAAAALPLIGHWPAARQQAVLLGLFALGLLALFGAAALALTASNRSSVQVAAVGQAQTQSQRLAKSVNQALAGSAPAFAEVRESAEVLGHNLRGLRPGEGEERAAPPDLQPEVDKLTVLVARAEKSAAQVLGQQKTLIEVVQALRDINRQSAELLETAETVSSLKLQAGANAAELSAVGQLVMLTQRIGKSANEFLTVDGVSPEAVFALGKDLNSFREIAAGVLDGNLELRLAGTRDAAQRDRLQTLLRQFDQTRARSNAILGNLPGLMAAREAQTTILADSEPLRLGLGELQQKLAGGGALSSPYLGAAAVALLLLLLGGLGLLRLFVQSQNARSGFAEQQVQEAERQEREAKRVNDANQAAILRLMNELQSVAEGDLTQQATVTEDITGAIADSVRSESVV